MNAGVLGVPLGTFVDPALTQQEAGRLDLSSWCHQVQVEDSIFWKG